jgi:hypothetical protein
VAREVHLARPSREGFAGWEAGAVSAFEWTGVDAGEFIADAIAGTGGAAAGGGFERSRDFLLLNSELFPRG